MQNGMLLWQDLVALAAAFALWRFLVYFTRKSVLSDIKGPPGGNFVEGHMGLMFDIKHGLDYMERLSDDYGDIVRVKWMLGGDVLWISDPRALEHMLLQALNAWDASELFTNSVQMLFGPGLLASIGGQHTKQRRLLNPMFSSPQVTNMVPLFYDIGRQLKEKLLEEIGSETKEIDIFDWMGRATMEFIGRGNLGYQFNALDGRQNEYREAIRNLMPTMARLGVLEEISAMLSGIGPAWFRRLVVDLTPMSAVQDTKRIVDMMYKSATKLFQDRKLLVKRDGVDDTVREDLLSLLVRVNSQSVAGDRLSDEEAVGQLGVLIFAANDTTAGALSHVLQLLASHPEIQRKLRDELEDANADLNLDYDRLMSLPFLDAVCKETLRLHPPVTTVARCSQQDDVLPLMQPIETKSGRILTEVPIPKGTTVFVGIPSANRSKSIWGPDAREWVPERWLTSGPVAKTRLPGAFSSMMTFMGGERSCIGFRMAFLELKIVLSALIPTFQLEPGSGDIVWHLGSTTAPFVQGKDGAPDRGPELPIRLSRVGGL